MNLPTGFGKSVVFQALSFVHSYVEPTGCSLCTAALFLAWEPQTYVCFPQNDAFTDRGTD